MLTGCATGGPQKTHLGTCSQALASGDRNLTSPGKVPKVPGPLLRSEAQGGPKSRVLQWQPLATYLLPPFHASMGGVGVGRQAFQAGFRISFLPPTTSEQPSSACFPSSVNKVSLPAASPLGALPKEPDCEPRNLGHRGPVIPRKPAGKCRSPRAAGRGGGRLGGDLGLSVSLSPPTVRADSPPPARKVRRASDGSREPTTAD